MTKHSNSGKNPLDRLNPEQRQAVEHGIKGPGKIDAGPLAIIAGAGTGKTDALACRAANLVANGVDPRRILLMTFTNKSAREITTRASAMVAAMTRDKPLGSRTKLPWAGTFHSIGLRLILEKAVGRGWWPENRGISRT